MLCPCRSSLFGPSALLLAKVTPSSLERSRQTEGHATALPTVCSTDQRGEIRPLLWSRVYVFSYTADWPFYSNSQRCISARATQTFLRAFARFAMGSHVLDRARFIRPLFLAESLASKSAASGHEDSGEGRNYWMPWRTTEFWLTRYIHGRVFSGSSELIRGSVTSASIPKNS